MGSAGVLKVYFIINPAAGKADRSREIRELARGCMERDGRDYEIYVTSCQGDGRRHVSEICHTLPGEKLFVACGGDGTLNEVVSGSAGFPGVSVTHYPVGSGNDFIKCFALPEGTFLDMDGLINGRAADIDLIKAGPRRAVNICSVGLDADIADRAQRIKRYPFVTGRGSYDIAVCISLLGRLGKRYTVSVDGEDHSGEYAIIVAANGICYGGGYYPMPEADPSDGRLEFMLMKPMPHFKVAGVLKKYKKGLYREVMKYVTRLSGSSIEISAAGPMCVNMDGEIYSEKKVKFTLEGDKVKFLVPRTAESC